MKRINGCKVKEIVKYNKEDWYILNGHNEKVYINSISDFTISQVTKMNKKIITFIILQLTYYDVTACKFIC